MTNGEPDVYESHGLPKLLGLLVNPILGESEILLRRSYNESGDELPPIDLPLIVKRDQARDLIQQLESVLQQLE